MIPPITSRPSSARRLLTAGALSALLTLIPLSGAAAHPAHTALQERSADHTLVARRLAPANGKGRVTPVPSTPTAVPATSTAVPATATATATPIPPTATVVLPSAIVVTVPVTTTSALVSSGPQPTGLTGSWNLTFADEFNAGSLDQSKWQANWNGGSAAAITAPVNSAETTCYDPGQVAQGNGELDLSAVTSPCTAENGVTYPTRSGLVESNGKFNFTYGLFEARIWTPAGTGMWPAFWSDGQTWPNDGEIDTLEAYGTDNSSFHYHYPGGGPGGSIALAGATAGWHTYAADWEPGVITWYYDGQKVWQLSNADLAAGQSISASPQYLILNLGVNAAQSVAASTMRVDYVRVWQH